MTVCAQKQDREIIESSNNRIIESAEASASGSDVSHGVTETRSGEIIESSNNRIIELAEASASGSVISHGGTETRSGEIIELSNNRIIESEEASAFGSAGGRGCPPLPTVGLAPCASRDNSIIRTFDYSIIDSISAQIEFFPNGDFITRSNNVERVYRRVNPDDWDDDGIENEEDEEPMVAADETRFGPQQTLPDGANSNAYCWVDLVVPRTNATFVFNAEISEFGRRGV